MGKLIDEFNELITSKNSELIKSIEVVGVFLDICWGEYNDPYSLLNDPAFLVKGEFRYIAFQRINHEIRYYATSLPEYQKEFGDDSEFGIVYSVNEMISLVSQYLRGINIQNIDVKREKKEMF